MASTWAPGEQEELVLRPHPLAWTPHYLAAASFSLVAGLLLWWFHADGWSAAPTTDWARFWSFLYGNGIAAGVYTVAALMSVGIVVAWLRGSPVWVLPYATAGVGAVALSATYGPGQYAWLVPSLVAPWTILALAWVEAERRNHTYTFTNLRIRHASGIPRRERARVAYRTIADLDLERPFLGRALDLAHITPVPLRGDPALTLRGMRPARKVRRLLQAMVDRFQHTPYAESKAAVQDEMEQAIASLRRRPRAQDGADEAGGPSTVANRSHDR